MRTHNLANEGKPLRSAYHHTTLYLPVRVLQKWLFVQRNPDYVSFIFLFWSLNQSCFIFIGNFWPLFRCFNTHLLMQKVSTLTTWLPPNSVTKLLNYNVFSKRLESQTSDVASTALYYCLTNILLRKRSKITKMPQNYLLFAKYYSSQGCRQTVQTTLALNILF